MSTRLSIKAIADYIKEIRDHFEFCYGYSSIKANGMVLDRLQVILHNCAGGKNYIHTASEIDRLIHQR